MLMALLGRLVQGCEPILQRDASREKRVEEGGWEGGKE